MKYYNSEKITFDKIDFKIKNPDKHIKLVQCIICGENIVIENKECCKGFIKVCDNCKNAVMNMRELTHQHEDKGE